MTRGDHTDQQWQRLEPLLPPPKPHTRRPNEGRRKDINGILWHPPGATCQTLWQGLKPLLSLAASIAGIWDRLFETIQAQADAEGRLDWEIHYVDGTTIRAHQHAAGAKNLDKAPTEQPENRL